MISFVMLQRMYILTLYINSQLLWTILIIDLIIKTSKETNHKLCLLTFMLFKSNRKLGICILTFKNKNA